MPRSSTVTPVIVAEVARRRRAGEPWKVIAAALREQGVPASRTHLWRVWIVSADVSEHRDTCAGTTQQATQA